MSRYSHFETQNLLIATPARINLNLLADENLPNTYVRPGAVPPAFRHQASWDTGSVRPTPASPYGVHLKKAPQSAPLLGKMPMKPSVENGPNTAGIVTKEKKRDGLWGFFCSKKSKDSKGSSGKDKKNPIKDLPPTPKTPKSGKLVKKPSQLKLLHDFTASTISIPLSTPSNSSETHSMESAYPISSASSARTRIESSDSGSVNGAFPYRAVPKSGSPTKPPSPSLAKAAIRSAVFPLDVTPQEYRHRHIPVYFTLGPSWHADGEAKDFDLVPMEVSERDYYEGVPARRPTRKHLLARPVGPPPDIPLPPLPSREDIMEPFLIRQRAQTLTGIGRVLKPIDECGDAELDIM